MPNNAKLNPIVNRWLDFTLSVCSTYQGLLLPSIDNGMLLGVNPLDSSSISIYCPRVRPSLALLRSPRLMAFAILSRVVFCRRLPKDNGKHDADRPSRTGRGGGTARATTMRLTTTMGRAGAPPETLPPSPSTPSLSSDALLSPSFLLLLCVALTVPSPPRPIRLSLVN